MTEEEYREVGRNALGEPFLRTRIVAFVAALFGIRIKIGDWPYGTNNPDGIGVFHARCKL